MLAKKAMSKQDRKKLEQNITRNKHQRKENKKDINRLKSKYIEYFMSHKKIRHHKLFDVDDDTEITTKVSGETVRGLLA